VTETSHFLDEPLVLDADGGTPERQLLPADWYQAQIILASTGPTKNGLGRKIDLTWEIDSGEYEKRRIWQTIVYKHSGENKEMTEKLARYTLHDIGFAVGLEAGQGIRDLGDLLYKPCRVKVAIRVDKNGQYDDRNEVKRVEPLGLEATPKQKADAAAATELKEATKKPPPAFKASTDLPEDEVPF